MTKLGEKRLRISPPSIHNQTDSHKTKQSTSSSVILHKVEAYDKFVSIAEKYYADSPITQQDKVNAIIVYLEETGQLLPGEDISTLVGKQIELPVSIEQYHQFIISTGKAPNRISYGNFVRQQRIQKKLSPSGGHGQGVPHGIMQQRTKQQKQRRIVTGQFDIDHVTKNQVVNYLGKKATLLFSYYKDNNITAMEVFCGNLITQLVSNEPIFINLIRSGISTSQFKALVQQSLLLSDQTIPSDELSSVVDTFTKYFSIQAGHHFHHMLQAKIKDKTNQSLHLLKRFSQPELLSRFLSFLNGLPHYVAQALLERFGLSQAALPLTQEQLSTEMDKSIQSLETFIASELPNLKHDYKALSEKFPNSYKALLSDFNLIHQTGQPNESAFIMDGIQNSSHVMDSMKMVFDVVAHIATTATGGSLHELTHSAVSNYIINHLQSNSTNYLQIAFTNNDLPQVAQLIGEHILWKSKTIKVGEILSNTVLQHGLTRTLLVNNRLVSNNALLERTLQGLDLSKHEIASLPLTSTWQTIQFAISEVYQFMQQQLGREAIETSTTHVLSIWPPNKQPVIHEGNIDAVIQSIKLMLHHQDSFSALWELALSESENSQPYASLLLLDFVLSKDTTACNVNMLQDFKAFMKDS